MEKKPLYLLSYDHGGYILWGEQFAERLSSAGEWMQKYPKFKFGLDNEAGCYDLYAEEYPQINDKIRKMLKLYPGRFGIGSSTYGQPLSVFIDNESNIRQLTYTIETELKHFGVRPPVYAISEHALHAQIPQLIAGCGYKMAIMRTHFQMYGFNPTYPVSFGTWQGMDGSRVPTVPTYDGEGAHFASTTIDNWVLTRWPKESEETLEDLEKIFENVHPALGSRYDDVCLRNEELTAYAEKKENYHWVVLEDFEELYKGLADQMDFVTKPQDFTVRMPWGYCGNAIFRQTVKAQDLVNRAERVCAAVKMLGEDTDCGDLDKAWKNLLIGQHHDIQICGLRAQAKRFIGDSIAASKRVIARSMKALYESLGGYDAQNILVFNPSAQKQKQRVACPVRGRKGLDLSKVEAVCGEERYPCRVRATEMDANDEVSHGAEISFVCELDGLSAKVFHLESGECEKVLYTYENGVLSCGNFIIALSENGVDEIRNQNGEILLKDGHVIGAVNDTVYQSGGRWAVYPTERGVTAKQVGTIGVLPYSLALTVDTSSNRIDWMITTEHHGENIGIEREYDCFRNNRNGFVHEDKLRFIFTPGIERENAYGVYTHPFVVDKTDEMYIEGNDFAAYSNGEKSIVMTHDGGKCLTREDEKLSVPLAFSHKYAWGDKRLWGMLENGFSLHFIDTANEEAMLDCAEAAHLPFMVQPFGETETGMTGIEAHFVDIKMSINVRLSAFTPSKNGVLLRFWETAGENGEVKVDYKWPHIMQYVDFLGNVVEEQLMTPHHIVSAEMILEDMND